MIQHKNIKSFSAAKGFLGWHCQSDLLAFFSPWKVKIKIPINSGLPQAKIAWKIALGCWFHQILC
jgi:hypothetical protein